MKIIIVSTLVLGMASVIAAADERAPNEIAVEKLDMYMGVDYFTGDTEYDMDEYGSAGIDLKGFRLKFGKEIEDGLRLQGYLKKEAGEMSSLAVGGESIIFDKEIAGMGVGVIKSFSGTERFFPFVQMAAGFDWRDLASTSGIVLTEDSQLGANIKLGLGALIKITNQVELTGGFDAQYRTWQEIKFVGDYVDTLEISDISKTLYAGVNFFF